MQAELPSTAAELVAVIDAATDRLAQVSLLLETDADTIEVLDRWEVTRRKGDNVSARLVLEAEERDLARVAGYLSTPQFLRQGLRLDRGESARRRAAARETGRLRNLQGEQLPPRLPECAAALAEGAISAKHVDVIADIMHRIPAAVAQPDRDRAEKVLADAARTLSPDDLPFLGNRILAHLDPDGQLTDDADRKRQRGFLLCPQDRQLMSKLRARVSPELRAKLEVILTVWAAPGMNNPADPESPFGAADRPGLDPQVITAAAERDDRSQFQRNHDALVAVCDFLLGHQALGKPDRIPAELVITVTEAELVARAGTAVTATGTRVPVGDLVDLAAHANTWLEVFADHTQAILYFGRGRRLATKAQRLALFGRDRGCTAPGCRRPFAQTEAHHAPAWAEGGHTDVDRLGAACGPHNRREGTAPGQWESAVLDYGPHAGRMGWRPAGTHGPWQVNPLHHPEVLIPREFTRTTRPPATTARPDTAPSATSGPRRPNRRDGSVVEHLLARHLADHRRPILIDIPPRE